MSVAITLFLKLLEIMRLLFYHKTNSFIQIAGIATCVQEINGEVRERIYENSLGLVREMI
jgi:hypothetical protein